MKVALRLFDKPQSLWRQTILSALFIGLFNLSAIAQMQKPLCPTLQFVAPVYEVKQGQSLTLTIKVTGGDPNVTPTYNWAISDGIISSGQGTSKIEIDTAEVQGATVTATVEIGGMDRVCSVVQSHTVAVIKKPVAVKVYEGNFVNNADLEKQIDELVMARVMAQGKGYIIFYAGRKAPATEIKRLTDMVKARIKNDKEDAAQYIIIEGGARDATAFELWTAVPDADPPKPNPSK